MYSCTYIVFIIFYFIYFLYYYFFFTYVHVHTCIYCTKLWREGRGGKDDYVHMYR